MTLYTLIIEIVILVTIRPPMTEDDKQKDLIQSVF
jgi:hypothetical protein